MAINVSLTLLKLFLSLARTKEATKPAILLDEPQKSKVLSKNPSTLYLEGIISQVYHYHGVDDSSVTGLGKSTPIIKYIFFISIFLLVFDKYILYDKYWKKIE